MIVRVLLFAAPLAVAIVPQEAGAAKAAPADALPVLEATIEMPGVEGRIDHLALDAARKHLFVAALANDTLEILDVAAGAVLAHRDVGEPQGVLYLADLDRVAVTSGAKGTVELYEGATLENRGSIAVGSDADNLRYDARSKRLYVAYGDGALAVVDIAAAEVTGKVELGAHPEAFQLDPETALAFVNVPGRKDVAVVDLARLTVRERWALDGPSANFPIVLVGDDALALGCRTPPGLLVRARDGKAAFDTLELSGDVDDLSWDPARGRLYAACGAGSLDVFARGADGRLSLRGRVPTADGARTCLFVPEERRIYVACPKREKVARALVLRVP